ncbi:unnamed protein product (macronuclear) [Paramecium tetraurelia]|uniref:Cilium assembly protein DZIP1 N-terminal domain-containing protein n=1 Tax=Paramecium tetraurelia TaxID=5888 RepID=A0CUZ3_PARTE|nr:uncharacterized protein GSPATT00010778001 [Paramecium tetraurelia]CAK74610.1 unnamed protein product [Paramecium tetraurelia]|eukprot:XP_001442007.1 hypothetical protein (macronuclear) [Paramecium tetraurelia strain d4-2]
MSQTIRNSDECQLTFELVENIINYYQKINPQDDKKEINSQFYKVEEASVCFKVICHYMDQLTIEHEELLNQYQNLEQQLISKEAEARRHIQIEQQLKLYAESLLENSEESQKQMDSLNSQIISIQKENISLKQQLRANKNERVQTDASQERLITLISQQKSLINEIPFKNSKKRSLESQKYKFINALDLEYHKLKIMTECK